MSLSPGTRLGRYDVTALIGEGGMGQVWQATDTQLGRQVALKILPDAFAADPDRLARFKREAQILASLNHPNIAEVSPDGRWIAYVSGEEVWVQPFPDVEGGRWQISRDGGGSPVWGPAGRELFFRRGDTRDMMVVAVETEPTFDAGTPEFVFSGPYISGQALRTRPWDVAADGRFLMVKESAAEGAGGAPYIVVVRNWIEELKRLVPRD